ncbi:MAG: glycogen/starch synthase [Fidelibacterota bacterium]
MPLKTYFLTSEITPFSTTGFLADFSKNVPIYLQEMDHDIRLTSPKYGFISERKYILREVIRLREIECELGGEMIKSSAKSAFIPKTRVQVYFMEHPEWFQPLSPLLYKSRNGRVLPDNADRFGFFSKMGLAMLTDLFWCPDIIICNSWQAATVPLIYNQVYANEEFYQGIQTVLLIHSLDENALIPTDTYQILGVELPEGFEDGEVNSLVVGALAADLVIAVDSPEVIISSQLAEHPSFKPHYSAIKGKVQKLKISDDTPASFQSSAKNLDVLLRELAS